jgi:tetratricopeptide (TPR) repeat protein
MNNSPAQRSIILCILCYTVLGLAGCDRLAGRYYYKAGEELYFAGKYSEAIKAYAMRGLAHYALSEYDLAIADNNRALDINPKYAAAYNGRGLAYYRKGEFDKTIADMEKVVEYSTDRQLTEPAAKVLQGLKGRSQSKAP